MTYKQRAELLCALMPGYKIQYFPSKAEDRHSYRLANYEELTVASLDDAAGRICGEMILAYR